MLRTRTVLTLLAAAEILLSSGCGGDANAPAIAPMMTPQRGELLTNPPMKVASYSTTDLLTLLGTSDLGKKLVSLVPAPSCSVDVYQLQYETVGGKGESTSASGALMVPTGTGSTCTGSRPIVEYAHGTSADKTYNITQLATNGEGLLLAAVFAANGYIVVAPNYAGYDTSTLTYHPYLDGDQQSKDMIDALTAARSALPVASATSVTDNRKLFITGYSQGGYVAMATHRAVQAANGTVTASAPMSGPYTLSAFADAVFLGEVTDSAALNLVLLTSSYQQAYGNVYATPTDVFETQYATGINTLLPSTTPLSTLYSQGKLPQNAVFSSTPPAPQYASITPATVPAELAPIFALGFGSGNLVTNAYRLAYLQDAAAQPDGGFPTLTNNSPPAAPVAGLRVDLKTNDLRNWSPTAPLLMCGGSSDPTVLFLDTQLMQSYWTTNVPAGSVTVLDVDSAISSKDPYATIKTAFTAAKAGVAASAVAGGATDGGTLAVLQAYHAGLVPPFCLAAVKSFFDAR
jgi:hypothetical protein